MKHKANSLLNVILIATLLASMLAILPPAYAAFEVYMVPSANVFDTDTVTVSYKWNITFYARDIPTPGAFAFQFKCFFNPAFLNVTGAWLATGDPTYIFFGKSTVSPTPSIGANNVLVGDSILVGAPTSGAGPFKLGIVEFHVIASPGKYESFYSDLDINNVDTYLLDESLAEIAGLTKTNGYVQYDWAPPTTIPTIVAQPVDPLLAGATLTGTTLEFDQYHEWNCTYFDVEIILEGLSAGWALHNASFTLSYDTMVLDDVSVAVDPAWAGPGNTVGIVPGQIDVFVEGYTPPPPSGDVLICTITFHIFNQTTTITPTFDESALELSNVILWDTVGTIDFFFENGNVIVWRKALISTPWLEVDPADTVLGPELVIGQQYGQLFTVKVVLEEIHFAWELVGYNVRLTYDPDLLMVVEVKEGEFLKRPEWNWYGTFFVAYDEGPNFVCPRQHVLAGGLILPNGTGYWDQPNPEGTGVLFEVTFKPLKQSWIDTLTDTFEIYPIFWDTDPEYLIDESAVNIPVDESKIVDGTLTILPISATGRVIDVWMCDPELGGMGIGTPADLVLPQMGITLCAKVTYNWQPVAYKKVTFEIRGPFPHGEFETGDLWAVLQDDTCDDGHATAFFRMPWTGHDAEELIGTWGVMVSVTLADVVITDIMEFDYDYLIHIWSVTTDQPEYYKCNTAQVTVDFGTKSTREFDVTMYVTIQDELGVPINIAYVATTVGGAELCHYTNFTLTVPIHIETFAYAGLAEVRVSFVFGLPSEGGEAAGQEVSTFIWILPVHADDPWFVDP